MDDIIKLVSYGEPEIDEYGNEELPEIVVTAMCRVDSVTRAEFYQAAHVGLHPEVVFILSSFWDYNGEQLIRWTDPRGKKHEYSVTRTYKMPDSDELQIVATERIGNDGTDES